MTKQKITISIDSDIAMKLRDASIKKYGNARSMSRLIEDLAEGDNAPNPDEIREARIEYLVDIMDHPDNQGCGIKSKGEPGFCGKKEYAQYKCKYCGEYFEFYGAPSRCPVCGVYTIFTQHREDLISTTDMSVYQCTRCDELFHTTAAPSCCPRCYSPTLHELTLDDGMAVLHNWLDVAARRWAKM